MCEPNVDVLAATAVTADDVAEMQLAFANVAKAPRDMPVRRLEAAAFALRDRIRARLSGRDAAVAELIEKANAVSGEPGGKPCDCDEGDMHGDCGHCELRAALARVGAAP